MFETGLNETVNVSVAAPQLQTIDNIAFDGTVQFTAKKTNGMETLTDADLNMSILPGQGRRMSIEFLPSDTCQAGIYYGDIEITANGTNFETLLTPYNWQADNGDYVLRLPIELRVVDKAVIEPPVIATTGSAVSLNAAATEVTVTGTATAGAIVLLYGESGSGTVDNFTADGTTPLLLGSNKVASNGLFSITATAPDAGLYRLFARATSENGLLSDISAHRPIVNFNRVYNSTPSAILVEPLSDTTLTSAVSKIVFKLSDKDDLVSQLSYQVKIDDQVVAPDNMTLDNATGKLTINLDTPLNGGNYTVEIVVTDPQNNMSKADYDIIVGAQIDSRLTVVDQSGNPVANALIDIAGSQYTTAADGSVSISLEATSYSYQITATGFLDKQGSIALTATNKQFEIALTKGGSVNFKVVDQLGDGIENATIKVLNTYITSDAQGDASLILADGSYIATVQRLGYTTRDDIAFTVQNGISDLTTITLGVNTSATFSVDIKVVNALGKPISGATVTGEAVDGDYTTDTNGYAKLNGASPAAKANGSYSFTVQAAGYQDYSGNLVVASKVTETEAKLNIDETIAVVNTASETLSLKAGYVVSTTADFAAGSLLADGDNVPASSTLFVKAVGAANDTAIPTTTPDRQSAPTQLTVSQTDDGQLTAQLIAGAEYSIDDGQTWQDSNQFSGLAEGDYTIVARQKATEQLFASVNAPATSIEIEPWQLFIKATSLSSNNIAATVKLNGQDSFAGGQLMAALYDTSGKMIVVVTMSQVDGLTRGQVETYQAAFGVTPTTGQIVKFFLLKRVDGTPCCDHVIQSVQ